MCLASKLAAELFPARKGAEAVTRPRAAAARHIGRALQRRYMVRRRRLACLARKKYFFKKKRHERVGWRTSFADYVAHAVQFMRLTALR